MAQTPDGTLWIGSTGGLYSFNGKHFKAFEPAAGDRSFPSNAIRSLFVASNGDLWVEGSFVGVARLTSGRLVTVGDPNVRLFQIRQDSAGTIWAVRNYSQVVTLGAHDEWVAATNPLPGPGYVSSLYIDSADTHWVVEDGRLYRRPRGQVKFDPTTIRTDGQADFSEDEHHNLWIRGSKLTFGVKDEPRTLLQLNAAGEILQAPALADRIQNILTPGDGTVWLATPEQGVMRLAFDRNPLERWSPTRAGRVAIAADSSFKNPANTLLKDAYGDIWAGGLKGLERFERASMVALTKDSNTGNWSTCANPQGEVWVASDDSSLSVLRNGVLKPVHVAAGYAKLFCSATGDIWFLDQAGIGVVHQHHFEHLPLLPGHKNYGTLYSFISFIDTPDHALLASMGSASERGLWKFKDGAWKPFAQNSFAGFAHALWHDRTGEIFVGRTDGKIFVLRDTDAALLREQATELGVISAFCPTAYGLFVVGANGVALQRGDGFHKVLFAHPDLARTVTGLQEADSGDLWINGARGIVRIPAAQIVRTLVSPDYAVEAVEWSEGDNIGPASFNNATASVAKDSQGKLWFATLDGVVSLQGEEQPHPSQPPHIAILAATADGQALSPKATFAPHPQTLNISYFGINLARPEKVVYRYMLKGINPGWQDVGHRTEAIYTRLKPGHYTFQVASSNEDGNWSRQPASVSFTVLPAFYQTFWFVGLCIFLIAFVTWGLFTLRLRTAANTIMALAEERANERVRIARDLHDTLLQGVQGLMLSFHVAAEQLPEQHGSRRLLDRALSTADSLMIEGRDRVSNLRAEHFTHAGLLEAIRAVALDLDQSTRIVCRVSQKGSARDLPPHIAGQVFYIAREALTNAFRHSQALLIELELDYSPHQFLLSCRDDGKGFDPEVFLASHAKGHWGIRGIMERASEIGGQVEWLPAENGGTTFHLVLRRSRLSSFFRQMTNLWINRPKNV